jgi:uncharacterized integral membrane protein (TIGR00698 family)
MLSKITTSRMLPGILMCLAVSSIAWIAESIEVSIAGRAWIEALVFAILFGTLFRTFSSAANFGPGVDFAAKYLLELAVVMMGATISFGDILSPGAPLLVGILFAVVATIGVSFLICRALGLTKRMALLIACGNAICGNSAIASVAPVIDADSDDVAAAVAFTAVLGIAVVLLIPLVAAELHLSAQQGGVLAGLTVYAVPQVLAAASPMGVTAVQVGTLVKLVRVLMLGPVVTGLALLKSGTRSARDSSIRHSVSSFLPPFVVGFLALAAIRSSGLMPDIFIAPLRHCASTLTVVAMAGLGLGVDLRDIVRAGPRLSLAVMLSLLFLGGAALLVVRFCGNYTQAAC